MLQELYYLGNIATNDTQYTQENLQMYKLTYKNSLDDKITTKFFKEKPTCMEITTSLGLLLSSSITDKLLNLDTAYGFGGTYSLKKIPTVDQLNDSWNDFIKVGIYQGQRFGQWFFNQYDFEVDNSYNIELPYQAYTLLLNALSTTLDEALSGVNEVVK